MTGFAFALAFVVTHFLPSHPPVRWRLVEAVGPNTYMALYSLVSVATWGPLAFWWWVNLHEGPVLWVLPGATWLAEGVALVGFALLGAMIATPAPSSLVGPKTPEPEPRGVLHVTRHPAMMGLSALCIAHLLANGQYASVIFWGAHLLVALGGAVHQDMRLCELRQGYADFTLQTSLLPHPRGLTRMGGRAWILAALGVAVGLAVRWAHPGS